MRDSDTEKHTSKRINLVHPLSIIILPLLILVIPLFEGKKERGREGGRKGGMR